MPEMLPTFGVVGVVAALAAIAALAFVLWRGRNAEDPQAAVMADLAQRQADTAMRLETMMRLLGDRQSQLQNAVNERLDSVSHRLGAALQETTHKPSEEPHKLHERR